MGAGIEEGEGVGGSREVEGSVEGGEGGPSKE